METDRTPGELKMKFRASSDGDSFEFQIHNNGNNTVVSADEEKLTLQVSQISENSYSILCDGESFRVTVENESDEYRVAVNQYTYNITLTDETKIILEEVGAGGDRANHTGELHAPILLFRIEGNDLEVAPVVEHFSVMQEEADNIALALFHGFLICDLK